MYVLHERAPPFLRIIINNNLMNHKLLFNNLLFSECLYNNLLFTKGYCVRYDEVVGRRWEYEEKDMDNLFNLFNCGDVSTNCSKKTEID